MAQLHFFALSDRWVSASNNDVFCAEKIGKYHVFGVAEGMSDFPGESSASGIAISSLKEAVQNDVKSPAAALEATIRESDIRINAHAVKSPERVRDITHLSACLVDDALNCTILDIGEGNAYLISPGGKICVPTDHPLSHQPDGLEVLTSDHGEEKKRMNMISRTLGEPHILTRTDFVTINIRGIFLLLSSGGLHDFVRKERIAEIILQNGENVESSCERLLQEALSAGSERTITLVLVHGCLD
jgi:serine/threonine protein phosphatase PrpC